jgi:hypothetical protein
MAHAAIRRGASGQATVEHVGLTVVVALLFGALAMWVAATPWAPDSPPPVIERVAASLTAASPAMGGPSAVVPATGVRRSMERTVAGGRGDGPGVVRRAWDGLLWWGALNVDGQIEAGRGFLEQVGIRADDLVKDPVKTIEGAVERLSKPPITSSAVRVGRIVRTIATAGDRPFRESFLGVSRDLGGIGADWLISKFARGAGQLLDGVLSR